MMTTRVLTRIMAVVLLPALAACGRDDADTSEFDPMPGTEMTAEAVRVTDVELGRAIGADRRITDAGDTDDFAPTDTVYVSVATEGNATGATLTARWTFEDGQVVDETSQTISSAGPTVTEFHIAMAGGLAAGSYQVEILLDGQSVRQEDFEIRGG